jgi:hypothetical protein
MSRSRVVIWASVVALLMVVAGDGRVLAAKCTPLGQGTCHACKNCKYCKHCSANGGRCSVCR